MFSEATTMALESFANSTGKHPWWSLFLYKDIFQIDWHHERLKNAIYLLLFYGEHFHGFLESDLWKCQKKNISQQTYTYQSQTF